MRSTKVFAAIAVLALAGIACSSSDNGGAVQTPPPSSPAASSSSPGAAPIAVSATQDLKFVPATITVKAGTQVKWTVTGSVPHTVTSPEPGTQGVTFDSNTLNEGQSFSFTFATPGTFHYYCKIHGQSMSGTITVTS
jgi:plastocyanin